MENSNKPAYPQSNQELVEAFMEVEDCAPNGLSKREAFAMAAMQGLLASGDHFAANDVDVAVEFADALLKELEETQ